MIVLIWMGLWCYLSNGATPPVAPLSTKEPGSEGFIAVSRQGEHKPHSDHTCFTDKRKTFSTNHWWVPAIQSPSSTDKTLLLQLPYVYNLLTSGMEIYYPYVKPGADVVQNMLPEVGASWIITVEQTSIQDPFYFMGSAPSSSSSSYCVKDADDLTATIAWGETLETTIVRGSPYVTMRIEGSPVKLNTPQGIQRYSIDGIPYLCGPPTPAGKTFVIGFKGEEEWTLFAPTQTSWKCDPTQGLSSKDAFFGLIRLALTNNCTSGRAWAKIPQSHCGPLGTQQPGDYPRAVVEGSPVCTKNAQVNSEAIADGIRTTITWNNYPCWGSPTAKVQEAMGRMMMTALPHHLPLFGNNTAVVTGGGHRNILGLSRGVMVTGNTWVLTTPYGDVDWLRAPDVSKRSAILKALKGSGKNSDVHYDLSRSVAEGVVDAHTAGKMLAKLANLVLIADQLGDIKTSTALLGRLTDRLAVWLNQRSQNRLVYDATWGGIISCGCSYVWDEAKKEGSCSNNASKLDCPALNDTTHDFGNAAYNGHHFQYGYLIYAAAVVAKYNPSWATQNHQKVLALIRDIANPSPQDPHFTTFRHFDWYTGHSWSGGINATAYERVQGSSSEAANAWYGIYLYGLATKNEQLKTLGNALLLMEAHSANHYIHAKNATTMYLKEYKHDTVGNVSEMAVSFQSPSGTKDFFTYGLQLLPISPIIPILFQNDWVALSWPRFNRSCVIDEECKTSGIVSLLYAEQALLDREGAWHAAQTLPPHAFADETIVGKGTSHTALLYFIAAYGKPGTIGDQAPPKGHSAVVVIGSALLLLALALSSTYVILTRQFPVQASQLLSRFRAADDAEAAPVVADPQSTAYGTAP